jgi:hypothetical protein
VVEHLFNMCQALVSIPSAMIMIMIIIIMLIIMVKVSHLFID